MKEVVFEVRPRKFGNTNFIFHFSLFPQGTNVI